MANAKPSRPNKSAEVDPDAIKESLKDEEKLVKKDGREWVEKKIQGKTVRTFVDQKKA